MASLSVIGGCESGGRPRRAPSDLPRPRRSAVFGRRRGVGASVVRVREVECDVDDHVFLAADHSSPSEFEEDLDGGNVVSGAGRFGVAEEAAVDAGIAKGEGFSVDSYWTVL